MKTYSTNSSGINENLRMEIDTSSTPIDELEALIALRYDKEHPLCPPEYKALFRTLLRLIDTLKID